MSTWNVSIEEASHDKADPGPHPIVCKLSVGSRYSSYETVELDADNLHVLMDALNAAHLILEKDAEARARREILYGRDEEESAKRANTMADGLTPVDGVES